ncbi:MAG: sucrose-6-phosphate hydrolase, partial [Acholeplasmatales bacterium]|nr:sucrose-6-phosphate hydrolase [Acholeplasmatales bacterium]
EGSEEQLGKVGEATNYMKLKKALVNKRYAPTYHAVSPVGWVNDPNGLSYFNGNYNLYFQYNPYDTVWGPMHWGHYTTKDFIKWELENVALAPDMPYDNEFGIFSGSAIEYDGLLYAMYTGVANGLQQQCIATSKDGINFEKLTRNPVISEKQIPNDYSKIDFRDPYIFVSNDYYHVLIGTKNKNNKGTLLLYKSKDLKSWNFVGEVLNTNKQNEKNYCSVDGVFECPSYAEIGGKEILICSPQFLAQEGIKHQNIHSVVYMIGQFDYQTGKFNYEEMNDLDSGFDFYAAQTLKTPDGRTIMIAWMQMWDRNMPTQQDGWAGGFTLPRELSIKDNHLYQAPVREIEKYRIDKVTYQNQTILSNKPLALANISGKSIELELTLNVGNSKKAGVKLFKGTNNETLLYYDSVNEEVVIDRSNSGQVITGKETNNKTRRAKAKLINGTIKLRIFLDVSTIEVFINDGYSTLSTNVYPDLNDDRIEFYSENGNAVLNEVTKYTIKTL